MKAGDIMTKPVLATSPRAAVLDVANKLVKNRITGMPVADRAGKVLGVITEADILVALIEGRKLETLVAEDIMSPEPVTVDVNMSMTEVMNRLNEEGILRVPVTDQGVLVGIISRVDIIRAMLAPKSIRTMEPEFMTFQ